MDSFAKRRLGERLNETIRVFDMHGMMQVLKQIDVLDDPDICHLARPLASACYYEHWRMAEILIARGASPNYTGPKRLLIIQFLCDMNNRAQREFLFLLRKGSWVPRNMLSQQTIYDYVYRNWNPGNHKKWPDAVRNEVRQLLLISRCKRLNALQSLGQDPLFYLFRWIATDRFTFV